MSSVVFDEIVIWNPIHSQLKVGFWNCQKPSDCNFKAISWVSRWIELRERRCIVRKRVQGQSIASVILTQLARISFNFVSIVFIKIIRFKDFRVLHAWYDRLSRNVLHSGLKWDTGFTAFVVWFSFCLIPFSSAWTIFVPSKCIRRVWSHRIASRITHTLKSHAPVPRGRRGLSAAASFSERLMPTSLHADALRTVFSPQTMVMSLLMYIQYIFFFVPLFPHLKVSRRFKQTEDVQWIPSWTRPAA
jgi:hypothetical protein